MICYQKSKGNKMPEETLEEALNLFNEMYEAQQKMDHAKTPEQLKKSREIYKEKALKFIESESSCELDVFLYLKQRRELNLTQEELEKVDSKLNAYIRILGEDFYHSLSP